MIIVPSIRPINGAGGKTEYIPKLLDLNEDVAEISASGKQPVLHTMEGDFYLPSNLIEWAVVLDHIASVNSHNFKPYDGKAQVNKKFITGCEKSLIGWMTLQLSTGKQLPVSRKNSPAIRELIRELEL